MAPKPVTQASRRGKRVIASPTPTPSTSADGDGVGSDDADGEGDELDLESEDGVGAGMIGNGAKGGPSGGSSAVVSEDMDIDADEEEEEMDMDMDVDMDDEYREDDEDVRGQFGGNATSGRALPTRAPSGRRASLPKTTSSSTNGNTKLTSMQPSVPAPISTPRGLKIRLSVNKPSPLGPGHTATSSMPGGSSGMAAGAGGSSGQRPAREAAKKAGKRAKQVAMEEDLESEDEDAQGEEDELDPSDPEAENEEDDPDPNQGLRLPQSSQLDADADGDGDDMLDADGEEVDEYSDDTGTGTGAFSSRAVSPSKLTARQRAKGNKDLQGGLMALPTEGSGAKKLVLTEAERLERREEMARRRKRQSEQRKQDEQDQTINRLLRAQTGRSRNKIEAPEGITTTGETKNDVSPGDTPSAGGVAGAGPGGEADMEAGGRGGRRRAVGVQEGMIRWVSGIDRGGKVTEEAGKEGVSCRVGIPVGMVSQLGDAVTGLGFLTSTPSTAAAVRKTEEAEGGHGVKGKDRVCAVEGCKEERRYRSVKKFEVGGCSLQHLRMVNEGIDKEAGLA